MRAGLSRDRDHRCRPSGGPRRRSRPAGEVDSSRAGQTDGAGRRDRQFHCDSGHSGRPRRRGSVHASSGRGPMARQVEGVRRAAGPHMTTFRSALDDQLQGYLDHLTIERGVAANTLSSYRRDLRRYSEHLVERGIDDLTKVTEADVSDFLVSLRRGDPETKTTPLSAVSAARAVVAVRGLHRFAASAGLTEIDVAREV